MNYHVPKYDELKYNNTRNVVNKELSKIKHLTSDKLTNQEATNYIKEKFKNGSINIGRADIAICIQVILKKQNLYNGQLDGRYGPKTKAAVKKLQTQLNCRKKDGIFGRLTASKLFKLKPKALKAKTYRKLAYKVSQIDQPQTNRVATPQPAKPAPQPAPKPAQPAPKAQRKPAPQPA